MLGGVRGGKDFALDDQKVEEAPDESQTVLAQIHDRLADRLRVEGSLSTILRVLTEEANLNSIEAALLRDHIVHGLTTQQEFADQNGIPIGSVGRIKEQDPEKDSCFPSKEGPFMSTPHHDDFVKQVAGLTGKDLGLNESQKSFLKLVFKDISGLATEDECKQLRKLMKNADYRRIKHELEDDITEDFVETCLKVLMGRANSEDISSIRALKESNPTRWRQFLCIGDYLQQIGEASSTPERNTGADA